jgi:hypothetical protein
MSLPVSPALANGRAEGRRRLDAAHSLLTLHRESIVRDGQRALLLSALQTGSATADDVRQRVTIPDGIGPRCLGAVPSPLARLGMIRRRGYVDSVRPVAHARPVTVWELIDRGKAEAWLATHPPITLPESVSIDDAVSDRGAA